MQPFEAFAGAPPFMEAVEESRCITACAADLTGHIRFANALFRDYAAEHYGWNGNGDVFSVEHIARGDHVYLRERVEMMSRVMDGDGAPVRCLELSGGRAVEHTCIAWNPGPAADTTLCVCASAKAVFDEPGACAHDASTHWLLVPTNPSDLGELTHAEFETLRMIALGLSTEDIGERLSRTKKAIERRRMSIRRKLGLSNRMDLLRLAIDSGLGALPEHLVGEFVRCARQRARHLKRHAHANGALVH